MFSQTTIQFHNPSFEGIPKPGTRYIAGWTDCSSIEFEGESPVDLQPGFFKVDLDPFHGSTYLGMVTKAYGVYESACQEMKSILIADSLYQFSIYLTKSSTFVSPVPAEDPSYLPPIKPVYKSRKDQKIGRKRFHKSNSPITVGGVIPQIIIKVAFLEFGEALHYA